MTLPDALTDSTAKSDDTEISLIEIATTLRHHAKLIIIAPMLVGALALGGSFLITPTFTANAQIMPPQQQQSGAAALLGSIAGLSSVAGAAGLKNPADQWIGLLKSRTIADALIARFDLKNYYESRFMFEARNRLEGNSRITAGKDSLIDIEVTDENPKLASEIANAYVEELQKLSKTLAVSEAAQRRLFFERQLKDAKENLIQAETSLRASGISASTLKTNPEAAISGIAQLKAQITATEVNLSVLKDSMTPNSPMVRQATAQITSLKSQLSKAEQAERGTGEAGNAYVQRYRDFKYYETLFELLARQYELAKSDEAKDGAVIQVVDQALVPEWKSAPKRGFITVVSAVLALFGVILYVLLKPSLAKLKNASAS